ncbi:hypothetical protein CAPTEDRAFT_174827 [Capitella teleta]|uniref:Obg-like ATPase 1 n=1 Tax=Capitella teleta TaxID=283909 RepID=R7UTE3_CAPTE|nr:hypothetical protein CAPTEDRAFT_174827 [Capitella teleta]|eukprot:ELU09460.1 hypothetical protein CAPTEDRAFT_174827 [Capitella teleta]
MPPKKKGEKEEKPVIMGRMGTNLKCGIVGLPNVGKSTFFNVLTKSQASAENFPFCTIDPNESRVPVPDERWDWLCDYFKPASKVPAFLNVVDIAGLVKGAHEGQGLGNAFLSNISACDALFHMVRIFEDEEVTHVEGEVNPVRDMEIIFDELRLKDLEKVRKNLESLGKTAGRTADKAKKLEFDVFTKAQGILETEKKAIRFGTWDLKEIEELNKILFITAKPMVYLVNMSEKHFIKKKNKWLVKIKEWIDANDPGSTIIPFSGALELKLIDMSPEEVDAYCKEIGAQSNLQKIILMGYKALGLMYYFTCGEDEVKAWTIQKNTKAPQAAGRIHTDFEKGFIMAEIMKYDDFKAEGSEVAVKAAGKYKQKGRDYIVEDGDIIHFKFNAGAGLSEKKKK